MKSIKAIALSFAHFLIFCSQSVHNAPVSSLAFDPSVTLLASGSADHTTKVWDIVRGYYTHNFRGHTGVVRSDRFRFNS